MRNSHKFVDVCLPACRKLEFPYTVPFLSNLIAKTKIPGRNIYQEKGALNTLAPAPIVCGPTRLLMVDSSNKIDRLNRLVELVRLTATSRKSSGDNTRPLSSKSQSTHTAQTKTHDINDLRRRLVIQLSADVTQSNEQVSRTVFREILLWEFGQHLEQHAEFNAILDVIEKTFESNPSLRDKMSSLVSELKSNRQDA